MKLKRKIKVYLADKIHEDGIDLLSKNFAVAKVYGLTNDKLLKHIITDNENDPSPGAVVVRSTRKIDRKFIKTIAKTNFITAICTVSSGFDNIDIETAKEHKIKVLNVPYGNFVSAAEHTIALLLAINKKLPEKHNELVRRKFISVPGLTTELCGKTIGIIGVGKVGSNVAKLSRAFGMKILGNDIKTSLKNKYKWIKFVSLNTLLRNSDYVTVHTPLDKTTWNLINSENLKLMNENSVILNCARGGIINELALYTALKKNRIAYAGLDVFLNEPDINFMLAGLKNVLLTPHLAGKTKECYKRMALQAAEILINFYK